MNARTTLIGTLAVTVAVAGTAAGYWIGTKRTAPAPPAATPTQPIQAATTPEKQERKVLYWHDPMVPGQKFDKPGKSPFMDMQLVPVYADEAEQEGGLNISSRLVQNLGVRTVPVETGSLSQRVDTVGSVQINERRIATVQSRASGWVEQLHVRSVNDTVSAGQIMAEIYAPELLAAQEEYLLLRGRSGGGAMDRELAGAARQRLSFLGMSEEKIARLEREGRAERRVAVHAPISGIVTEIGVREGAQVNPGMALFNLVDLSSVWVLSEVPESQASWIAVGRTVELKLAAHPGVTFEGIVDFIYPGVSAETRTVRLRSQVANPRMRLKPGMVADVTISGGLRRETLLLPNEAVIRTGKESVVIVQEAPGKFRRAAVVTGMESGDKTEILRGLQAGDEVVVSGQFLIDSEANLRSGLTRLEGAAPASPEQQEKPQTSNTKATKEHEGHEGHVGHEAKGTK